ncbi:MAG: 2-oxoacid:acceptor oxidoreductase subunit alpha [Methanomassiliicoccales archaeon]|nr:MAG: 2-oxoacid:acceptor oxidoreductase subunit alpha [Methanomassiliicoccales archaeon]
MNQREILTGEHFMNGDEASAEGAIAAGCRFFAGYPITPATEIAERMSRRLPEVGGIYIQMEDELASMGAILGASWAGVKTMTATSGPGFSLMMENYGLGVMTETPCVIVDIMRGGPSTGLPTLVSQGDVMQSRWGTHGDIGVIAFTPSSPQEMFDCTIKAFNLSEQFRLPVVVLGDEIVGHMTEKVVIPKKEDIKLYSRRKPKVKPNNYLPFAPDDDLVPPMACAGEGYNVHVTGLTHDERGYPVINAEAQEKLVGRIVDKIRKNANKIIEYEEIKTRGSDVVVVAYGSVSRCGKEAVRMARAEKMNVGLLRPLTIWPFPEKRLRKLSEKVKAFVVPEVNYGQIAFEVERCVASNSQTLLLPKMGGDIHTPEDIFKGIKEMI